MAKQTDTIQNFKGLLAKIHARSFSPVYLLHGTEPYFIDRITQVLEDTVLNEADRSFNQSVLYGKDVKMHDLVGMARRFPMMASHQVIVLKEAQTLKEWDKLESYLQNPLPSTILVICYRNSKFDMRLKVAKLFQEFEVFLSEPLKDYQLKLWLPDYFRQHGRTIDSQALERLLDLLGTELTVIHNEIDKMLLTVKEEFIKVSHVDEYIGLNRTYNVFELINALSTRNFNKAVQIAHHMSGSLEKVEYLRMLPVIDKFFTKVLMVHESPEKDERSIANLLGVNAYFVKDYLAAARYYNKEQLSRVFNYLKLFDLRIKGVNRGSAEEGDLLVETVVNIVKN